MKPGRRCAWSLALVGSWISGCDGRRPVAMTGFVDAPTAAVAAQIAGRLDTLTVQEGAQVQAGQLLAQLDARDRAAALAQAEANLARTNESLKEAVENLQAAVPTVRGAGADTQRAQATLDEAQQTFDRTRTLVESKAATPSQLDSARARLLEARASLQSLFANKDVAKGRVRAALAAVDDAKAQVRSSEAALELARVQLAQAQVLAPFDGVVINRNLEPGEWVAPGTPVVTLEDSDRLWVRIDVEETRFRGLHLEAPADIRVIALPGKSFRGHVIEIGAEGDFAVNRDVRRGRPDIRTFRVRVAFDDRAPQLRPGMTAEVRLLEGDGGAEP